VLPLNNGAHVSHIYTLHMLTNDIHITIIHHTRSSIIHRRRVAYYILLNLFNGGRRFWTPTRAHRMDCDRFVNGIELFRRRITRRNHRRHRSCVIYIYIYTSNIYISIHIQVYIYI